MRNARHMEMTGIPSREDQSRLLLGTNYLAPNLPADARRWLASDSDDKARDHASGRWG